MSNRVTWLIPILNGMPYLPETLASIEAQTYKDWEVLVWDNGSTDGTLEELKKWIPDRLPGRIFIGEPHGVGGSLKRLVEECKTEFCARIDADDINLPERLEKQVAFLNCHPEIAVVGSQAYCIDEEGGFDKSIYNLPTHHDDIVHTMLVYNAIAHPSVVFRRSAILQVGNYKDISNVEDYDLWLRVATDYRLANLGIPLVKYRLHNQSTTQIAIRENRLNNALNQCISENSDTLIGCTSSEILLLKSQQHPFAIQALYKIAKYLNKKQGGKLLDRVRSDSFIQTSKNMTSSKDIMSRLAIACLDRRSNSLLKEVLSISKSLIMKLPTLQKRYNLWQQHKIEANWHRSITTWLNSKKKEGTNIHPSIYFVGGTKPNLEDIEIESECYIDKDFSLWISEDKGSDAKLKIKSKAYIARDVYIGVFKPVTIGESVQIGAYSYIISGNHRYLKRDIPIQDQGYVGSPITIEDYAWIGTHVVVLPGVTIGKGAIIAAHSLVNKNVPPYEVWGGVPVKFIKHRP
jgi:acetyltransferase-like isoleucine patch superfamily enzyme